MKSFTECRKRAGLTQIQAADALHVDKSTVAKWESENHLPRYAMLIKVATLYGCTMDDLLKGDKQHDAE